MKLEKWEYDTEKCKWTKTICDVSENTGKSCTDKSKYRPNVNCLNDIAGATMQIDKSCYEFVDGKDTGIRYYDIRNAKDITERNEAIEKAIESGKYAKEEINQMINESDNNSENSVENTETTTQNNA